MKFLCGVDTFGLEFDKIDDPLAVFFNFPSAVLGRLRKVAGRLVWIGVRDDVDADWIFFMLCISALLLPGLLRPISSTESEGLLIIVLP